MGMSGVVPVIQAQGMVGDFINDTADRIRRKWRGDSRDSAPSAQPERVQQPKSVALFDSQGKLTGYKFPYRVRLEDAQLVAENSAAAFARIQPKAPSVRVQILAAIRATGKRGMIAEEVLETFPAKRYSTITARISELAKAGEIVSAGSRETKYSGSPSTVWVDKSEGGNEVK